MKWRWIVALIGLFFADSLFAQQLIGPEIWDRPLTSPTFISPLLVFGPFNEAAESARWAFLLFATIPLWHAWAYKMNNAQSGHDINQGVISIVLAAVFAASVPLATNTFNDNLVDPLAEYVNKGRTRMQMISRIWEMTEVFQNFRMAEPTEKELEEIIKAETALREARDAKDRAASVAEKRAAEEAYKEAQEGYLAYAKAWYEVFFQRKSREVVDAIVDPAQNAFYEAISKFSLIAVKIYRTVIVWLICVVFIVLLGLAWGVAMLLEMVRQGLLIGMSIMLPFFIGCLPHRTLGTHGRTFVFQFIGVCLWPLGFAIVDMGMMALYEGFLIILIEPFLKAVKMVGDGSATWSVVDIVAKSLSNDPIGAQVSFKPGSDLAVMAEAYGVNIPATNAYNMITLRAWLDPTVYFKGGMWLLFLCVWVVIGTIGVPIAIMKLASSGSSMLLSNAQTATDMATAFAKEKLNAVLRGGGGGGGGGGGATPPLTPQAIGKAVADAMRGGGGSGGGGPSDVGGSDLPPSTPPSGGGDIPEGGGSSGGSSGGSGGGSSGGAGGSVPPFLATPVAVASAADKVAASGVRATGNAVSSGMDKVGDAMSSEQSSGSTGGGKGSQDFWTKSYQSAYGSSGDFGSGSGDDAGVSGGAVGESQTTARRRVHVRTERDDDGDGGAVTSALRSGSESSQQTRRAHVRTERDDDGDGGAVIRRGISDSSASSQSESIIRRGR